MLEGAGPSCNDCEKQIATGKENSGSTSAQSSEMSPKLVTEVRSQWKYE